MLQLMEVVEYQVNLPIELGLDGHDWLAACPPIDVVTQAHTKKEALRAIQEAVELWFESCIDHGVLVDALKECGFKRLEPDEPESGKGATIIRMTQVETAQVSEHKGAELARFNLVCGEQGNFIEGFIPCQLAGDIGTLRHAPI